MQIGYAIAFILGMATMMILTKIFDDKDYTQEEMDETIDSYEREIRKLKGHQQNKQGR